MDGDTLVIHIQTIKEQMRYDRTEFTVIPGMKVRLVLTNPDAMDHNLLVVEPGATAKVAIEAAKMETAGTGVEKHWRPDMQEILFGTKMLPHGASETLEFTAPTIPGRYDYICTFPGHWQLMRGVMIVSDTVNRNNLLAAQAAPEEMTEASARKVVEYWEMEMLEDEIDAVFSGRNFETGKEMFTVATCVKCHVVAGEGTEIGPDLTEISSKYTALEILEHIIDPGLTVEEEYKTFFLEMNDGDELFGQITQQDDTSITVLDNPLTPEAAVTVNKADIKEMDTIEISVMPSDLLIMLQKEEIWDLVAYVHSGGDPSKSPFKN